MSGKLEHHRHAGRPERRARSVAALRRGGGEGVAVARPQVLELDPRDGSWVLPAGTDVVFLALHGTYGEDGTVQRQLDELGVLYTGCDAKRAASRSTRC